MNTRNNRRRRASVERIQQAFVELIQTRELYKITVSDICQRCGVNRSTFYANFTDIYDLADRLRERIEGEVSGLYEPEAAQGFNSNNYLKLFRHIRDNQLLYRTYFKLGYDNQFRLQQYDARQAQQYFGGRYIDYHVEFFRCGLNAIIKLWLDGGCLETPEEMEAILRDEYQGRALPPPAAMPPVF